MTVRVVDEAFVEEEIPVWSDGYLRGRPALIEDAGGMPVLAYAVPDWDGATIRGFVRTPAGWAPRLSIGCSWSWCREREPALAAGSVPGTAWIAWAGTGIKVALWHHSDSVPAGAKPMPLTRSSSDRTPDVALAPGGSVVVAWARACAAPDPGLYLATNRSGRWVISRVVAGCGIEDPSLAVRLDGRIVIAFTNGDAGVRVLTEAAAP
jgi:hypothetical protein